MHRDPHVTVAIIGGGPAGLMAAEHLARDGVQVTVYERMSSVGRKFLMAGRGGLNLTHSEDTASFNNRYGDAALKLKPSLDGFSSHDLVAWCHGLGQETFIGSSGRIFPREMKASPLLRAWLLRLENLGVSFKLKRRWEGWNDENHLLMRDEKGHLNVVKTDAVVLALGGGSWPRLGSDGSWTELLAAQQIEVKPLRPSNCGFGVGWSAHFQERFAGQPLKPITLSFEGQVIRGETMITANGLEGGAIYTLSRKLRDAIEREGKAMVTIDLKPGLAYEDVVAALHKPRGSQSSSTFLRKAVGLSPLAISLMRESMDKDVWPTSAEALAHAIKYTQIRLSQVAPLDRAISSAGGVAFEALTSDLMVKKKPGTFIAGEMLDWEAPTGGYLLQASFSTAVMAAAGVRRFLRL